VKAEDAMGLTEHSAGRILRGLAKRVPADQCIVEIGVYTGRSLLYMAEGSLAGNGAVVWGVDPWHTPRASEPKYKDPKTFDYAMTAFAMSEASHLIKTIRDYGVAVGERWDGPRVGLLYVDADHRYAPVLADVHAWLPHFAEDCIVAFDDYHDDFPGVIRAVDELVREGVLSEVQRPKGTSRLAVTMWTGQR
jgi:cephalosporin hydroxylase